MKMRPAVKFVCSHLLALALVLAIHTPLRATDFTVSFSWLGAPIVGQDPNFIPLWEAEFEKTGTTLTLTLTNFTTQQITNIGEVLTGLTWDFTSGATLTALSAEIASGSKLVGSGATSDTDLSGEWAFKEGITAGMCANAPCGSFGIGSMGDINFGADSFGGKDVIDPTKNLFGKVSLNGIDGGIVGLNVDLSSGGFKNQGPVVQNAMVFTFDITGALVATDITNVQPLFGTDGAPLVPEPATLLLLGSGLLMLGLLQRKKFKG
jgi:hypothetical protein